MNLLWIECFSKFHFHIVQYYYNNNENVNNILYWSLILCGFPKHYFVVVFCRCHFVLIFVLVCHFLSIFMPRILSSANKVLLFFSNWDAFNLFFLHDYSIYISIKTLKYKWRKKRNLLISNFIGKKISLSPLSLLLPVDFLLMFFIWLEKFLCIPASESFHLKLWLYFFQMFFIYCYELWFLSIILLI